MKRTKTNFRALREMVGMSQTLLARLLRVDVRSVKRWENPDATAYRGAPDDAWELLEGFLEKQQWAVDAALEQVGEIEDTAGGEPRVVDLTYWHDALECEAVHPGEGEFWQVVNASSRRVAYALQDEGYAVEFGYPGLKDTWEKHCR